MSVIDTRTRTIAEPRNTSAHPAQDRKQGACAHRWVEQRRAHRPGRPASRLPIHAASA